MYSNRKAAQVIVVPAFYKRISLLLAVLCLGLLTTQAQAQGAPPPDAPPDSAKVEILHTDNLHVVEEHKYLEGIKNLCALKQQEAYIYFWHGHVMPENMLTASREVHINQNDTINIFSDSLWYNGNNRIAKLYGKVSLAEPSAVLFTDELEYNMNTHIGFYSKGGQLEKDSAILTSDSGYYYIQNKLAVFKGKVKVRHPQFYLEADSLGYETNTEIVHFMSPTNMFQEDKHIYCEAGYYDMHNKYGVFKQNARYESKTQWATGDSIVYDGQKNLYYLEGHAHYQDSSKIVDADEIIYNKNTKAYTFNGHPVFKDLKSTKKVIAEESNYDEANNTMKFRRNVVVRDSGQVLNTDTLDYNRKTHWGYARGNVVWNDSASHSAIHCQMANFNDSTGYMFATKAPIMSSLVEDDSFWVRADTLISFKDHPKDSARTLLAFHHARFFKLDIQGRCDSLVYLSKDSVFYMYRKPILWADSSQFTSDTIVMKMKDKAIHSVLLYHHAMIINSPDSLYFNQLKGDSILASFVKKKLRTMHVFRNGEAVYYLTNKEKAYSGVNATHCENMLLYFQENHVERIIFYKKPTGKQYPMHQVDHESLQLDGFRWLDRYRPKNLQDLAKTINWK